MADRKPNASGDFHRDSHPGLKAENKQDDPPNSRLFIVCGKSVTEEDFREAFHKFGTIEEIWMVKDRTTGEPKGENRATKLIFPFCVQVNKSLSWFLPSSSI